MEQKYNREKAVQYAHEWALKRNPAFFDFSDDALGGDCTNFISQCLYSAMPQMNYQPTFGWYYINANNRSPSWSGAEFFYNFITSNKSTGPFGRECNLAETETGDIIQLTFDDKKFTHSLIIVEKTAEEILVAAHTNDCDNRNLNTYDFKQLRCIKILGFRKK